MSQFAAHYQAIKQAGAEVLLVTFFPPTHTRNWARGKKLPYRLASDVSREAYFRYGLGDAKLLDLVGPSSLLAGAKAFVSTRALPAPTRYPLQSGGYFVVDSDGDLLYAYPSRGPGDHPPVEELLGALEVGQTQLTTAV